MANLTTKHGRIRRCPDSLPPGDIEKVTSTITLATLPWAIPCRELLVRMGFDVQNDSPALRAAAIGAVYHFLRQHPEVADAETARRWVAEPKAEDRAELQHWLLLALAASVRGDAGRRALDLAPDAEIDALDRTVRTVVGQTDDPEGWFFGHACAAPDLLLNRLATALMVLRVRREMRCTEARGREHARDRTPAGQVGDGGLAIA